MKNVKKLVVFIFASIMISSCSNDDNAVEQNFVSASIISNLNNVEKIFTTLKINCSVEAKLIETESEKGICWSKEQNPTVNDSKATSSLNAFTILIENLNPNTIYYCRSYYKNKQRVEYSEEKHFKTNNLENTNWTFDTYYPASPFSTGTSILSTVNFYTDGTTKFDEIGSGQGFFITYGFWSINENQITYIWEGNNSKTSAYTYLGTISGNSISGTYTHISLPPGTFSASLQ